MTRIYNQLDRMSAKTNAALVAIHHTSKGNQSGKSITDAGAGAGAQSRAADAHVVIREHECEDCYVLDAVVRSFPPPKSIVLQKQYPVFIIRNDLDPKRYAGSPKHKEIHDNETDSNTLFELIPDDEVTQSELIEIARSNGLSRRKVKEYLNELSDKGYINFFDGYKGKKLIKKQEKTI